MKRTKGTVERFSPDWIKAIPRWLARGIWDAIEEGIEGGEHAGTKEKSRRLRNIQLGNLNECNRGCVNMDVNAVDEHNRRRDERIAKTEELQRERAKRISERLTDARHDNQQYESEGGSGERSAVQVARGGSLGGESEAGGPGEGGQGADPNNVLLHPGGSELRLQDGGGGYPADGYPDTDGDSVSEEGSS